MSKKIIAALIAITLLFIGVFAACQKNEEEENKLYLEGDEYPFFTDKNGEKVLNDNGEFIVYQTDFDGDIVRNEYGDRVTQNQLFEPYSEKHFVEDYGYRITPPEKWTIDKSIGRFLNTETGDVFEICPVESTTYKENYDAAEKIRDLAETNEKINAVLDDNVEELGEEFGDVFSLTVSSDDGMYIVYTFTNNGNLYTASYQSSDPTTTAGKCIEMMKCITFKPYQYYPTSGTTAPVTTTAVTTAE